MAQSVDKNASRALTVACVALFTSLAAEPMLIANARGLAHLLPLLVVVVAGWTLGVIYLAARVFLEKTAGRPDRLTATIALVMALGSLAKVGLAVPVAAEVTRAVDGSNPPPE